MTKRPGRIAYTLQRGSEFGRLGGREVSHHDLASESIWVGRTRAAQYPLLRAFCLVFWNSQSA